MGELKIPIVCATLVLGVVFVLDLLRVFQRYHSLRAFLQSCQDRAEVFGITQGLSVMRKHARWVGFVHS